MKTIAKTLIAISVLMISLQALAGGSTASIGKVHYKVQVHLPKDTPFYTRNVFVVMTDENNRMIAPVQLLRFGVFSYEFYESTTVQGTRIAKLVYSDGNTTELFHSVPDSQTGRFSIGGTYLFNLYLVVPKTGKNEE
jgi:hypothetical protein